MKKVEHRTLQSRQRRGSLPSLTIHILETHCGTAIDGNLQRTSQNHQLRETRDHQYPTAGIRADERPSVRRSVAQYRPARDAESGHSQSESSATSPSLLISRPMRGSEIKVVQSTYQAALAEVTWRHLKKQTKLISVSEVPSQIPNSLPTQLAAWTIVANQILNMDETLNK